jgi:hypothetical protein
VRTVRAVRYVLPFRQGGSVPALVEADDLGFYVVKLRGAAQGHKALVAEVIAGELARAAGLHVPEVVLVDLDPKIAESEPDPEISWSLERSGGLNVGLDYLPGSITFDAAAKGFQPDATTASLTVLFDAFVANVDRTPRNANLLQWHKRLWLIDHGAALYFHHGWGPSARLEGADDPFPQTNQHVLLKWASALDAAASTLAATMVPALFARVVAEIPASWLPPEDGFVDVEDHRAAYADWLAARARALPIMLEEAKRAHASLVRLRDPPRRPARRTRGVRQRGSRAVLPRSRVSRGQDRARRGTRARALSLARSRAGARASRGLHPRVRGRRRRRAHRSPAAARALALAGEPPERHAADVVAARRVV